MNQISYDMFLRYFLTILVLLWFFLLDFYGIILKKDYDMDSVFMNELPKKDWKEGEFQETTSLELLWRKDKWLGLKADSGEMLCDWAKTDAMTQASLVRIVKGSTAKWKVRGWRNGDGVAYAREILAPEAWKERSRTRWANRKIWRHGMDTKNIWTA